MPAAMPRPDSLPPEKRPRCRECGRRLRFTNFATLCDSCQRLRAAPGAVDDYMTGVDHYGPYTHRALVRPG